MHRTLGMLVTVIMVGFLCIACSEEEVFGIQYQNQLRSFIEEDPDGIELFSQDVYPDSTASFKLDTTGDLYFYAIDNVSRTMGYDINTVPDTLFGFYSIVDAVVTINDNYTGTVYRIRGGDTTRAYGLESRLQRFAYFLKLYGNAYQYSGWRFWAYSCLNYTPDGYIRSLSGDSIAVNGTKESIADGFYNKLGGYVVLKQEIANLPPNDSLTYFSRYKNRIFAEKTADLFSAFVNDLPQGNLFKTGWRIPAVSDRYYHLVTIDSDTTGYSFKEIKNGEGVIIDSVMVKTGDIVIPYSLEY